MEDFRRKFLLEAAATLKTIAENLQRTETLSDTERREVFRTLHTVKGTAQTFGFSSASSLAHELENLLSAAENKRFNEAGELKSFFREGIGLLINSLERKDFEYPNSFIKKIRSHIPDTADGRNVSDNFSPEIPNEFFSQLTNQEKNTLHSALQNEKNIYCLEVDFELKTFADGLISFREALNSCGEIIATMPGVNASGDEKIGFQILFASAAERSEIQAISDGSAAEIIYDSAPEVFSNDAPGVLAEIVKHGRETAKKLGKQVRFETLSDETNLSDDKLKIVFEILLHLVRNAVDHAVETSGKIEISLKEEKNGWRLTVSDDGRGIDLEKIKTKAIKEKLFADEILTERETIDLIFLPEFSTKQSVTETSGRGVGLDAVKSAVEKSGGKIKVESRRGRGATFEIFLPR